jgi:uncharacterized protein (DUF111 family)
LPREVREVRLAGEPVRVKVVRLPDGSRRAKPEFDDVRRVAAAQGRSVSEVAKDVLAALGSL